MFDVIAFDADDTLWHSEILYIRTQDRFAQLMAPYQGAEQVAQKLHEIEMRNLPYYGYGIKGFALSLSYPLMIVTKGDLYNQEAKIARSGIGHHFRHIEIVSDKTRNRYAALLARHRIPPSRFLMVGNSLRSDILPVIELGGQAVYIPYRMTWAHENVPLPVGDRPGYFELAHLGLLPALIERLGHTLE